jgi:hypothetical protein
VWCQRFFTELFAYLRINWHHAFLYKLGTSTGSFSVYPRTYGKWIPREERSSMVLNKLAITAGTGFSGTRLEILKASLPKVTRLVRNLSLVD